MKAFLQKIISNHNPLRLAYHKLKAMLAAVYYGFPAWELKVVAITGTNGKTSTATYAHHLFMTAGVKAGLLTTAEFKIGDIRSENKYKQTSLSPFVLQKKLREMVKAGCEVAVMEATSHAMVQNRLWGVNVDIAVFTNLSHDHIAYHGSWESYRHAKGLLFKLLMKDAKKEGQARVSIVNADDGEFEYYSSFPADRSVHYGIKNGDLRAKDIEYFPEGTRFTVEQQGAVRETIEFPIAGEMNVYNALAAAALTEAAGLTWQEIKKGLESMQTVPGRVELIQEGQPFTAVVDYAHSEDSLEKLLSMFKTISSGQVILVFGATGGGRDQEKRPRMGAIAHRLADQVVLTNDDPYEEDPHAIAAMVREGIPREEGDRFWQVLNRKEAIRLGLSLAKQAEDVVIVAGKGAEVFQVVGTQKVPHDDREVVREYLAELI